MTISAAQVCNIALARVGQRQFIESLTELSTEAQVCKVLYEPTRDAVLAAFPWPFATKRGELTVLDGISRSGWEKVYALPNDCLAVQRLYPGSRNPTADARSPYALEHDDVSGLRVLLADLEDAELIYTARVQAVALYPPLFVDALAWRMAMELALALAVKPTLAASMAQGFERAMARAAAAELRQSQEDAPPDSEFIRAR